MLVAPLGIAPTPAALGAAVVRHRARLARWSGPGSTCWRSRPCPGNRAGGTSVVSAFKFAGNAAAPLLWLPLYHVDPRLGFLGAAILAAITGAFIAPLRVAG